MNVISICVHGGNIKMQQSQKEEKGRTAYRKGVFSELEKEQITFYTKEEIRRILPTMRGITT